MIDALDSSALEASLWVTAIRKPEVVDTAGVSVEDFACDKAAGAWRAVCALHAAGHGIGMGAVGEWLRAAGEPVDHEYLIGCESRIIVIGRFEFDRLRTIHRRRRYRLLAQKLQAATEAAADDELPGLLQAIQGAEEAVVATKVATAKEAATQAVSELFAKATASDRLSHGIECVDEAVGPMERSALIVVGASTGVGKSSLLLAMGLGASSKGQRVGIVSCEDSLTTWGSRMAYRWADVNGVAARRGGPDSAADWRKLSALPDHCPNPPLMIEQAIGATDSEVCASMRRLVRTHGCQVLMVDYLQTIRSTGRQQRRADQVSETASLLKRQASQLNVPLVLASQLRRPENGKENAEPSINQLKETGDIENMAEVVMLLWRPDASNADKIAMKIAKSKWGVAQNYHAFTRDYTGALREETEYDAG